VSYTVHQLKSMIVLARKLGYMDDVKHWQKELDKLQNGESQNG